jgi:peptidyl-prolyl isomerase D
VRQIENTPTTGGDKPSKAVVITNCGQLTGDESDGDQSAPDSTGDTYEDYPEDAKTGDQEFPAAEVLKIAGEVKEFGNKAYKAGNVVLGLEKYQKGLRYLNEDPELKDESEETKKALKALRFTLNSNIALLSNQLKHHEDALRHASYALDVSDVSSVDRAKALYRRAIAEIGLKDEDAALKDLEEANRLVPGDGKVVSELAKVKKVIADRIAKEKKAYSKFFTSD